MYSRRNQTQLHLIAGCWSAVILFVELNQHYDTLHTSIFTPHHKEQNKIYSLQQTEETTISIIINVALTRNT